MSPTEATTGFFFRSSITSFQIRSLASAEPPGESMRSTTALTLSSLASRRSVFDSRLFDDAAAVEQEAARARGDRTFERHDREVRPSAAAFLGAGDDADDFGDPAGRVARSRPCRKRPSTFRRRRAAWRPRAPRLRNRRASISPASLGFRGGPGPVFQAVLHRRCFARRRHAVEPALADQLKVAVSDSRASSLGPSRVNGSEAPLYLPTWRNSAPTCELLEHALEVDELRRDPDAVDAAARAEPDAIAAARDEPDGGVAELVSVADYRFLLVSRGARARRPSSSLRARPSSSCCPSLTKNPLAASSSVGAFDRAQEAGVGARRRQREQTSAVRGLGDRAAEIELQHLARAERARAAGSRRSSSRAATIAAGRSRRRPPRAARRLTPGIALALPNSLCSIVELRQVGGVDVRRLVGLFLGGASLGGFSSARFSLGGLSLGGFGARPLPPPSPCAMRAAARWPYSEPAPACSSTRR